MSDHRPQHHHRRARDEQDAKDDAERLKHARAATTMAAPTPTPTPTTADRHLASVSVRDLLPSTNQQREAAPTVSQPMQLGCWTKLSRLSGLPKEQRFLYGDRSGLARLRLPPPSSLPLSLDEGYPERFVRKAEGEEERSGVEAVVRGAQHHSTAPSPAAVAAAKAGAGTGAAPAGGGGIDWSVINVVTYRNNLNKILGVPIDLSARADAWCIDAVLLAPGTSAGDGEAAPQQPHRVLFLDIQPDPGGERTFPGQDRFMYYGYKLETVCTEQAEQQPQDGGGGGGGGRAGLVDSTSEYGALVAVRLGRHRVLMAAEIDAEEEETGDGESPSPLARLAEIKCYRPPPPPPPRGNGGNGGNGGRGNRANNNNNRAAETLFRLKHQRWWVQSFLAGVPTLVLGSRDDRGNLVAVQKVPVARLADVSRRNGFAWEGARLVAFGDALLAWMRRVAEEQASEGSHLRFTYDPRAGEVRACVVEGGELPARVRRALAEREAAAA